MRNLSKVFLLLLFFITLKLNLFANDKVIDSLSKLLTRTKHDSTRIDLHAQLSNLLLATDYKQSLMHATSAVRLANKSNDYARKIKSYKVAGAVCMYMGLNDLSASYYSRHYQLAESKADKTEMGAAYFNLGSVQMALGDYAKAKEVVLKAGDLLWDAYRQKGQSVPDNIVLSYRMNLGIIFTNLEELERSDSMIALAMPMVQGIAGMELQLQNLLHIKSLLLLKKNENDEALKVILETRELAMRLGDVARLTATYQSAGQIYQEKRDTVAAIKEFGQGFIYAENIGGIALEALMAEALYKLYQQSGKADSSIKYFNIYTRLKDQSKNEEAKMQLMREELLQEYKRFEVDLQEKSASEKRSYLYASIVALVLAFVGVFGTIGYRRRYKRLGLEQARKDLEAQRFELERERLELQVADQYKQLNELEYRLSKNAMLETLVTELQSVYTPDEKGAISSTKKQETSKLVQQGKIWEEFEVRFAKTHGDFYDRLVKSFPDITLNERRLCAFLKLDMTTKEISTITGQSVRAVEIARTRLRKKLNLNQSDTSLFEFLSSI